MRSPPMASALVLRFAPLLLIVLAASSAAAPLRLRRANSHLRSGVSDASGATSAAAAAAPAAPTATTVVALRRARLEANGSSAGAAAAAELNGTNASRQGVAAVKQKPDVDNMLGFDLTKVKISELTSALWIMAAVAAIGVVGFELLHTQCADIDLKVPVDFGDERHERGFTRLFAGVWQLVKPYLYQEGCYRQWAYIWVLGVLAVWSMVLQLTFALWVKEFWDVIENKKSAMFLPHMKIFVVLVSTMIVVNTYEAYIGMMLAVHWRKWMTQWMVSQWLSNNTYYQLQLEPGSVFIDNPDQRIQEDIRLFIETLMRLASGFCNAMGGFITMLPVLLLLSPTRAFGIVYMPGWLLYLALLYSGGGTLAAHCIGNKLILINFAKQKYEADLRYHVVQIRDNAESIALYGAEHCEREQVNSRFEKIVQVWWKMMLYTKRLGFFTAFYHQTSFTFPYIVLAPSYFKGQITLGTMFMLFRALGTVKGGFDWIIESYPLLTDFRATADRLQNFQAAISKRKASGIARKELDQPELTGQHASTSPVLLAQDVTVLLPKQSGGRILWDNAGLTVQEGEFILLSAPEGSGKSSFFRALAGIWPYASGSVHMPESVLFVPQRSYIPYGSLKQALAYPQGASSYTDEEVRAALVAVNLRATRGRDLSDVEDWRVVLSGGEQQRLAMARAVLRRPRVLFLDEACSAMGDEGALELYGLLRRPGVLPEGAAVISISHNVELLGQVHDSHYKYDAAKGDWARA